MINGYEIIDFHTHVFPPKLAAPALRTLSERSGIAPACDGTPEGTLALMDSCGVDSAVLVSVATKPSQQHSINIFLNGLSSERFHPFGAIHPFAEDWVEELAFIASLGFKGIKLHPDYQEFYPDDERVAPLFAECERLGLTVLLHAGVDIGLPSPVHGTPERIAKVASRYPDLTVIAAHLGGWRMWDQAEDALCGLKNVMIDTAFSAEWIDTARARRLVERFGAERVLLGSDCPWESPDASVRMVCSLGLDGDSERAILGGNARRILTE